jgi:hypothetical protein
VRAVFVLPDPDQPGLTAAERVALRVRNDATLTGRCVCGATAPRPRYRRGAVGVLPMRHAADCPAADGPVPDAIARRFGADLAHVLVVGEVWVG